VLETALKNPDKAAAKRLLLATLKLPTMSAPKLSAKTPFP
jgi:hypothetical protein